MGLQEIIENNYSLEPIIKIKKTKNGSGNTYFIKTTGEKYIVKINERFDFVHIYDKVETKLNQMNLLQSRIIKTNQDLLMTSEGVVLYEFISGDNYTMLSKVQIENSIKYIRNYNKALSLVSFKNEELIIKNHWDQAKSITFIVNEFPNILSELELEIRDKKNIYDAINILSKNRDCMEMQYKQLIHSDLGADNFIFRNDQIISIIDFTPDYNHELYSLCQFIYWNYLWYNLTINRDEINYFFRVYNHGNDLEIEEDISYLLLMYSALYRIVGPLLDLYNRNIKEYKGLEKRFFILEELIKLII